MRWRYACRQGGLLVEWSISMWDLYPDLNIAWQWLIDELDDGVGEVVLADGGYNDRRQYFIMPSG